MFSWLKKEKKSKEDFGSVLDGLKTLYKRHLLPLEEAYQFHDFHSPKMGDADFEAKPLVMLLGQYSTGKTTFIKYLLEENFPGIRIGPEPTTDGFMVVMHNEREKTIPGNALIVDPNMPYKPLSKFGNAFLNKFTVSQIPNNLLEHLTILDTPGILSGEKQSVARGYDFGGVVEWFAERADRIVLLFDAHKLDISDEFRKMIVLMTNYEDKVRIVLNKADAIDTQQLMRVYGALMWSLGRVFKSPEVVRIFIGSFWNEKLHYDDSRRLFELEHQDLFQDLQGLPKTNAMRKLNDFIKRARLAKVHAYIIAALKKNMPNLVGKDAKKKELIKNLEKIYQSLETKYGISPGDFPKIDLMKEKLPFHDFTKFNPMRETMLKRVDEMLATEIATLAVQVSEETSTDKEVNMPLISDGLMHRASLKENPFTTSYGYGANAGQNEMDWIVSRKKGEYDKVFIDLDPVEGKVTGAKAKTHLVKSQLPNTALAKIWKLADVDKDGMLDGDEFALAKHLVEVKLDGHELPSVLPDHLIPPSKRPPILDCED